MSEMFDEADVALAIEALEEPVNTTALTDVLKRPSMRCMICGLTAYARDPKMVKYGKSHYDCECGGHSFYPRAVNNLMRSY